MIFLEKNLLAQFQCNANNCQKNYILKFGKIAGALFVGAFPVLPSGAGKLKKFQLNLNSQKNYFFKYQRSNKCYLFADPSIGPSGYVRGLQTARRAHLSSINEALEWTYRSNQKLHDKYQHWLLHLFPCLPTIQDKVVIVSKENVVWKQVRGERAAGDDDLWNEIDEWLKKLEELKVEVNFLSFYKNSDFFRSSSQESINISAFRRLWHKKQLVFLMNFHKMKRNSKMLKISEKHRILDKVTFQKILMQKFEYKKFQTISHSEMLLLNPL